MAPLDKIIIKTDPHGILDKESEILLKDHLKTIGRIISPFGFNPDTHQVMFKITAFKDIPACEKVRPVLNSLIEILEPVVINPKFKNKFKAFAIIDSQRGYSGRYTLLINDKNEYAILKELKDQLSMTVPFGKLKDINQVLTYLSKHLPYHGT